MLLAERETLNLALEALRESLGLPEIINKQEDDTHIDAGFVVRINGIDFICVVKNTVTTANVGSITMTLRDIVAAKPQPLLLVARYISPTVVDNLASNGINTLDCVGNCYIRYVKGEQMIFQISNKGVKNPYMGEKTYPAFQEAGLKVIFYLLQDATNVNRPYREIQNATGVSLGAIKNVLDVLIERKFILLTGKKRTLKNKKALLNLWIENYNQVLKPKLLLGKMSFRTDEHRVKWLAMELPDGMFWGGESAANMIDDYLTPGTFDIYTDVPAANLFKTGFVKQEENGEIRVYQKFWKWETENHLVPLILIYADLIGSGNSRCMEMAERLLEHGLKDYK